jgi:hypothetical protein
MVLTYSTSGEPGRLRGARGLKYVFVMYLCRYLENCCEPSTDDFVFITESPRGSSYTS